LIPLLRTAASLAPRGTEVESGFYARTEEVIELARVAARYGGIYASHIRNETNRLLEAVAEAIEIGKRAETQVEISHLKLEGYRNWEGANRLLAMLEDADSQGVRVGCNQYPYTAGASWLAYILPYWAQAGGTKGVAQALRDPDVRAGLTKDWEENRAEWEDRGGMRGWTDLLITNCPPRPDVQGKNIPEIAADEGKDPPDAVLPHSGAPDLPSPRHWRRIYGTTHRPHPAT